MQGNQNKNSKLAHISERSLHYLLIIVSVLVLSGIGIAGFTPKAKAINAIGQPMGGFIDFFVPGYPWYIGVTAGYCPPHTFITVKGPLAGPREIAIIIPPTIPRANYNYFTPGVSVLGAYYPVPMIYPSPFSCPDTIAVPLFFGSYLGTGAAPSP